MLSICLNIYNQVVDIITINVEDGLTFHSDTVRGERITEDTDYQGVRINFLGTLENARINMQLDIGFGDIIHPEPIESELPTILDFPAPCLLCYSRESAIAEKFQAMIKLEHIPVDFSEIVGGLVVFLEPIVDAITKNTPPPKHWGVTTTWT